MDKKRRVMLKLSGEALAGSKHMGFDLATVQDVAGEVKEAWDQGVEIAVVIGGGNTAIEDALYLVGFCEHVYIMNRSKRFRASRKLLDKAQKNPKITVYTDMIAEAFEGQIKLERIIAQNTETGEKGFINASGVIIAIGIEPDNTIAKKCGVALCERGFVKTNTELATNVPGIYAAGDCRVSPLRQIITAAADGAIAATSAVNYVLSR